MNHVDSMALPYHAAAAPGIFIWGLAQGACGTWVKAR